MVSLARRSPPLFFAKERHFLADRLSTLDTLCTRTHFTVIQQTSVGNPSSSFEIPKPTLVFAPPVCVVRLHMMRGSFIHYCVHFWCCRSLFHETHFIFQILFPCLRPPVSGKVFALSRSSLFLRMPSIIFSDSLFCFRALRPRGVCTTNFTLFCVCPYLRVCLFWCLGQLLLHLRCHA